MIIDINDFNNIALQENKNRAVLPINTKAPDAHVFRCHQFRVKTGVKGILLKQTNLLAKLLLELPLSKILDNVLMNRENPHA